MKKGVIIVGAGSARCVLANRLSRDSGRRVLLIEAGPDYPSVELMPPDIVRGLSVATSHDWGFISEPGKLGRKIELLRGKLTGGSSAVNVTFSVRGWPDDYDRWAEFGNRSWSSAYPEGQRAKPNSTSLPDFNADEAVWDWV